VRVPDPLAGAIDAALELPIVPSFTKIGVAVRSRLDGWTPVPTDGLRGRVVVLTGATSGLGLAAAEQLAGGGATVVITGRDRERLESTAAHLRGASGNESIDPVVADMAEPGDVDELGGHVIAAHGRVDVVIHNAGALSAQRGENSESIEVTVAAQVLGPFRLTSVLVPALRRTARSTGRPSRVLTMSSGGMYAVPLSVAGLQLSAAEYDGTRQYALAKRAQVTLNQLWAEHVPRSEVVFHALHPGWADTPGVRSSLPGFARVVGPLLRSPAEGADTLTWLASDDGEPLASSGGFWLDRRTRPIHRLPRTRRSDTIQRREQLWSWCVEHSGPVPPA
jgi:dehydrogenase/reductase SDR family member 12